MTKTTKSLAMFAGGVATLALAITPLAGANIASAADAGVTPPAETQTNVIEVSNLEQLLEAIKKDGATIKLTGDIETTAQVNIVANNVTIDGNGKALKRTMADINKWESGNAYVLSFYKTTGTLKNIALTGSNAALLINGSTVTLEGKIDLSGNGFGGIELSNGVGVTDVKPTINFNDTTLVNANEAADKPTLWIDKLEADQVNVKYDGVEAAVKNNAKGQIQLFLDTANKPTGADFTELDVTDFQPEDATKPTDPTEPVTPPATDDNEDTEGNIAAPNTGVDNFASTSLGAAVGAAAIMAVGVIGVHFATKK